MPRVLISEPGKTPQPYRFDIDHKIIMIGRASDNDIVISCRSVSSKHCAMKRVKGGYILRDLDSTNGIKLDDSLMEVIDLSDGMEAFVGDVSLEFQLSDEELEELEDEEFTSRQKKKLPPIKSKKRKTPEKPKPKPTTEKTAPEPAPKPAPKPKPGNHAGPPPAGAYTPNLQPAIQQSGSPLSTLLVFILVLVAVFAGMTLRHNMRTGEFLPTKVMNWLNGNPSPDQAPDEDNEEQPDPSPNPEDNSEPPVSDNQSPEAPAGSENQDTAEIISNELVIQLNMAINAITAAEDKESADFAVKQLTSAGNKIATLAKRLEKLEARDEEQKALLSDRMTALEDTHAEKMKKFMPILFGNQEVSAIISPAMQDFNKRMSAHDEVFKRFGLKKEAPDE